MNISRRDYWIGVGLISVALLLHTYIPRYEWRPDGPNLLRIDRWTGQMTPGRIRNDWGRWVTLEEIARYY